MAKFKWGLLCERAIVDRERGATSYIDVIDGIFADQFPVVLYQATVSLLWEKSADTDELVTRISVKWPGSEDIAVEPEKFFLSQRVHRFNLTFSNIKIEQPGELTVNVHQLIDDNWQVVATLSYPIAQLEDEFD